MSIFGKFFENMFGWCDHDWSKWAFKDFSKNYVSGKRVSITAQIRDCKKCGRSQLEEIG